VSLNKVKTRNCRKYVKAYYVLNKEADDELVSLLTSYGELEVSYFSKYNPKFKDTFKIKTDEVVVIEGVFKSTELMITIAKKESIEPLLQSIEGKIEQWQITKS